MKRSIVVAVLACAGCSATASKMSPAVEKDLKCYLIVAAAAKTASPKDHESEETAATYYMGKLRVEAPDLDLAHRSLDIANAETSADITKLHDQCWDEMSESSSRMAEGLAAGMKLGEAQRPGP
jgi:hypothetical protein